MVFIFDLKYLEYFRYAKKYNYQMHSMIDDKTFNYHHDKNRFCIKLI